MAEKADCIANFISKIETELDKPEKSQNALKLKFWREELDKLQGFTGKLCEWFRFDDLICVAQGRLKLTCGVVDLGGVVVGVISAWLICIFLGEFTLIDKST